MRPVVEVVLTASELAACRTYPGKRRSPDYKAQHRIGSFAVAKYSGLPWHPDETNGPDVGSDIVVCTTKAFWPYLSARGPLHLRYVLVILFPEYDIDPPGHPRVILDGWLYGYEIMGGLFGSRGEHGWRAPSLWLSEMFPPIGATDAEKKSYDSRTHYVAENLRPPDRADDGGTRAPVRHSRRKAVGSDHLLWSD